MILYYPPHEWTLNLKEQLAEALNLGDYSIQNANGIEFFDVIVTNPPFGSKIRVKDGHILEQFQIGYIWRNEQYDITEQKEWTISSDLQSSAPPEQLFIERCLQFLKPGGRLAIVLPDSILGNPGLGYIRRWLVERTRIIASVDLHKDTFQPGNGTQTSVLILQKKSERERINEQIAATIKPYNIFMTMVEKVGHDKRGNTLFRRDEHGDEIWVLENPNVFEIQRMAESGIAFRTESRTRIIDDQSCEVPSVFSQWKQQEGILW